MWAFALALLGIGGIAGMLAIPLDVFVSYRSETDEPARAEFVWLFGSFRRTLRLGGRAKGEQRAAKARPPRRGLPWRRVRELWNQGLGDRVSEFLRALWGAVAIKELFARAHLGTGDPAETGRLMGVVLPLRVALVSAFPAADVQVVPDFAGMRADANVRGGVRVVPLSVLLPLVRFALAPITLRTAWTLRKEAA